MRKTESTLIVRGVNFSKETYFSTETCLDQYTAEYRLVGEARLYSSDHVTIASYEHSPAGSKIAWPVECILMLADWLRMEMEERPKVCR